MELESHWPAIKQVFKDAFNSAMHCSMATVSEDGAPRVTAIGSLVLTGPGRGYYCEEFPNQSRKNLERDQRVCFMAINASRWYWLSSLMHGRFATPPGVRLFGRAGELRKGTPEELAVFLRRVRMAKRLKGYDLLWNDMRHVRDLHFDSFEPVTAGAMTTHLWA